MLSLVELKRRLENIVQIGQISATKNQDGKALARVVVHDVGEDKRVTDFLPVLSLANSFFRVFFPIRVWFMSEGNMGFCFLILSFINSAFSFSSKVKYRLNTAICKAFESISIPNI